MTDPWGPSPSPQPPPPPGGPQPHWAGTRDAYRTATEPRRRSGAFRDTLIVAALTVAGVVGLLVWSGGDVSVGGGTAPTSVGDGGGPPVIAVTRR